MTRGMAYDVSKRPGEWVQVQARRHERRADLLVALGAALMLLAVGASLGLRSSGLAAALLVVMYLVSRLADRRGRIAARWIRGARSEQAVGERLNELRREGFTVLHDLEQRGEGNIDHLVSGPTGVYLIETKHRAYRPEQLRKAKRQAAKLHDELGVWVTPVICLDQRRARAPYRHERVWIVCRDHLPEWLRGQSNRALPFERLAAFADRL